MSNFQRIRSLLFYFSVFLFFTCLPFIIAFALGYKFNAHSLKFSKTGLIYIKTQPEGARVYLNGKLIPQRSPVSIFELASGVYKIVLELAQYYPWKGEVDVEAGKALRIDKIILFPLRPNLEQLNQDRFSSFRVDTEKKAIYYLDQDNKIIYKSNLDGSNFQDIASLQDNLTQIVGWDISPDKKRFFIFNYHQISVTLFEAQGDYDYLDSPVLLDYFQEKIINVFWHSDSYHLIVLTNKHVGVIESRAGALPINLVKLNKEEAAAFYDLKEDALYFNDSQKSSEGTVYNNLYKLELSTGHPLFQAVNLKIREKLNE